MADAAKLPPQKAKPQPSQPKPNPVSGGEGFSRGEGLESPRSVHC